MPDRAPLMLSIKEYCPDLPTFGSGSSVYVRNVTPRTDKSYGAMPSLQSYATSALPTKCIGAYGGTDPDGNVSVFAGTATDLYRMEVGATTFSNVSSSPGAYSCPSDEFWSMTLFNARFLAANISDPIQTFTMGVSTNFADLSVDAPKARYVTTAKNFLIAANTDDPIGGIAPWRVWWSALGDPTSWPTPGSAAAAAVQSDYNDTVGEGGAITGIVGNLGTADAAVFFERAVWRMIYVGPPAVFNFVPAEGVRGTHAPGSIVQLGSICFYLGEDGFYLFDGTQSIPIGANKVDRTFYADLDPGGFFAICGAVDPVNKLVMWAYPGTGHSNYLPNRIIIYNWVTQRWSIADIDCEIIFRALTFGYTLDGLDATGYNLDTLPFSLDSRVWTGGNILLGAFNTSHVLGYLSGSNLAATVDTDEVQPFGGQRAFFRNTRPIVEGTSVTPSVAVGYRDTANSMVTFSSPSVQNSLGWCPLRGSGRMVRGRITVPAASTFTHIQGMELDCDPIGVR